MFDPAMGGEIEHRLLAELRRIEVAGMDQEAILLVTEFSDDLAVGARDKRAAEERIAVLVTAFGDR